jgi:spoIIIJ-associated protein
MSDRDLDQYLEGLGIDVDGEEQPANGALQPPGVEDVAFDDGAYDEGAYEDGEAFDDLAPGDEPEFDMEAALSAGGVYGVIADDLSPVERTETFLVNLLLHLDPTYSVEVSEDGEEIHAEVVGGDSGRIIGKAGRTLAALEFLTNAVVNRTEGEGMWVVIDVGGYKRRRDDRLRQSAQKAAARVRKTGHAVELEPMSAAERRIVHMAIADEGDVVSESTGEGRARRVVVKPRE